MRRVIAATTCVVGACAVLALTSAAAPIKNGYYEWDSHKSSANFLAFVDPSGAKVTLSYYQVPYGTRSCSPNGANSPGTQGQTAKLRKGKFKARLRYLFRVRGDHQVVSVTGTFVSSKRLKLSISSSGRRSNGRKCTAHTKLYARFTGTSPGGGSGA